VAGVTLPGFITHPSGKKAIDAIVEHVQKSKHV
jgi:hypothetical protein